MGENGDNNYYYNNYDYNKAHNELDPHVAMAGTALILGLASIPLCFFLNIGVVIGGIAIVMALLSKGTMEKFLPQARRAVIFGILGIVLGYSVMAYDVHKVLTDPQYHEQLNQMSQQMNGVSFDDMLKEIGVSIGGN
ncbi:hypothetical protein [Butyrivibrio sp. FCS014]|uniref:hypothetical protein n=1 Tax=Butyrivibrio sp. FCS014 TaxID=1408304 RepID=UPI000466468D|nr:hypothetical protein [Butyrivibrio sp. FCS014]